MPAKIIRSEEIQPIQTGNLDEKISHEVVNLYVDTEISFAIIKLDGKNRVVRNITSESWYFVISGSGIFFVNGERQEVNQGNLIHIPAGEIYSDQGKMTLLCVDVPPFNLANVVES